MNALIQKEARLQLPTLAIGLLSTLLIWQLPNDLYATNSPGAWLQFRFAAAMFTAPLIGLMLALNCFGREISGGTFALLLAQPVPRARVWRTKTLLLALALALLLGLWLGTFAVHFRAKMALPEWKDGYLFTVGAMFTLVTFSGGLWTVLLLRQVAAAFWLTLLTPAFLMLVVTRIFHNPALENEPEPQVRLAVVIALSLYSLAGFLLARRLFLRAQDVQWSGGAITLPRLRGKPLSLLRQKDARRWRPRAALWFKELRLHQSQFVLAGVLAVLHVAVMVARNVGHGFKNSEATRFLLEHFWVLWTLMPWLAGCAAVAEERKLGTLESKLCLPAKRRGQFTIKLAVTLLTSVLLGAVAPLLFEGENILPDFRIERPDNFALFTPEGNLVTLGNVLRLVSLGLPFLTLAAIAIGTTAMSFYVSTFSRNTLQAIAPSTLAILAFYVWWFAAPRLPDNPLWRGWVIHYVGVPVSLPTLIGLAYWNFKQLHTGWHVWRRNSLVLGGAFAFVLLATGSIYHRAWEWLTPTEPKHGAAFLKTGQSVPLSPVGFGWLARLPDGRVWVNRGGMIALAEDYPVPGSVKDSWQTGEFLEGTNWQAVSANWREVLAIKTDGSLWVTESPMVWTTNWWTKPRPTEPMRLIRMGQENDWKAVQAASAIAFLLKTNGTLWRLGTNHPVAGKGWRAFRDSSPTQLGTDTDWDHISSDDYQRAFLTKTDGSVWSGVPSASRSVEKVPLDSQLTLYRASTFDGQRAERQIFTGWSRGNLYASVLGDGTFAVTGAWERTKEGNNSVLKPQRIPLGRDTNWMAAASAKHGQVVTLKSDGTLWKWKFTDDPARHPEAAAATRVGKNSDWVGLTSGSGTWLALAGDGTLWAWPPEPSSNDAGRIFPPALAPTRRPILVGQIPRSTSF